MKKLVIAIVLPLTIFLVFSASARESLTLTNPLYMPERGIAYFDTDFSYFHRGAKVELIDPSVFDYSGTKTKGLQLKETYRYGIINRLSFDFSIAFKYYKTEENNSFPDSGTYDYRGFENPFIGFTARLLKINSQMFDAGFAYSPDIFNSEDVEDGSDKAFVADGNHKVDVFAKYGKIWNRFTLVGIFTFRYISETEKKEFFVGERRSYEHKRHVRFKIGADSEYLMTKNISLNTNIAYTFRNDIVSQDTDSDINWRVELPYEFDIKFQLNYMPLNMLSVGTYYEYQYFGETTIKYKTPGWTIYDRRYKKDDVSTFGAKVIIVF